jgi:hypothetical protein
MPSAAGRWFIATSTKRSTGKDSIGLSIPISALCGLYERWDKPETTMNENMSAEYLPPVF